MKTFARLVICAVACAALAGSSAAEAVIPRGGCYDGGDTPAPTTIAPTKAPTSAPTVVPTGVPTTAPTATPTTAPTTAPTATPTTAPTATPTTAPTATPTTAPTTAPTATPTTAPTTAPTATPTTAPTATPTTAPTAAPTATPTNAPTPTPTNAPTPTPTTVAPTPSPTTVVPTPTPTAAPVYDQDAVYDFYGRDCYGNIKSNPVAFNDADCLNPFTFLVGTTRHYACFKCPTPPGSFSVDLQTVPFVMCNGKPMCSRFSQFSFVTPRDLKCVLSNGGQSDIVSACTLDDDN